MQASDPLDPRALLGAVKAQPGNAGPTRNPSATAGLDRPCARRDRRSARPAGPYIGSTLEELSLSDIARYSRHVSKVPGSEVAAHANTSLARPSIVAGRSNPSVLGVVRLSQLEHGRKLDRQIGRFGASSS